MCVSIRFLRTSTNKPEPDTLILELDVQQLLVVRRAVT